MQKTTEQEISVALWEAYKRPFVRDLAYAIACPCVLTHWIDHDPLLNTPDVTVHNAHFWQEQFEAYASRLFELDNSNAYQALTRFLINRPSPHRLGFHFEGLIHFWLIDGFKHGNHTLEVLAHNVQLFRDKQTTGELDYIIRNHNTGEVEHWELAIKFFVGRAPYDFSDWEGLNSRDNLKLKMTHMQSRQFNTVWVDIVRENETDSNKKVEKVKIDKRIGVIKGRFFAPITDTNFVRPDWLTSDFPIHYWIGNEDLRRLNCLNTSTVRRAHYIEWFTKRDFYDNRKYDNRKQTIKNPALLSKLWYLGDPPEMGLYFEQETPFVIYDANRNREKDKF